MRILIGALVVAALVLAMSADAAQAAPKTWYVQGGPTNGSGTSGSPFNTIQNGISAASNGDTVIVQTGSYTAIDFKGRNITVQSTTPSSAAVVAATIINGQGGSPIVTFDNGEGPGAVLQGFTITGGSWTGATFPDLGTAGIFILNASPTIRYNVIANNNTTDDGGGLCILGGSSPVVVSNTISGNSAGGDGGGVFVYAAAGYAAPQIMQNLVISNSAFDGGGLCPLTSFAPLSLTASIINNLIISNSAADVGGGVCVGTFVNATIFNDTIVANTAYAAPASGGEGNGGGIGLLAASVSVSIDSCLLYSNSAAGNGPQLSLEGGSLAAVSYSDLQGGQAAVYLADYSNTAPDVLTYGAGNLAADPLFASPATGDYHLQSIIGRYNPATGLYVHDPASSPGLAAGDPAFTYSGQPLPNGGRIEMGAYGNTAQASLAGAMSLAVNLLHGWVYLNAADAKPHDTLTVTVSYDPVADTSYSVSTIVLSGSGQVTLASTSSSSTVYVYGGLSVTGTGTCQILVEVAGSPAGGFGAATATITVRKLGDIDNSGSVACADLTSLNTRLNNLPTGLPDYNFDLTGDGYVTAADRVILNKILNSLTP
jgi:hypothetical protein